MTHSPRPNPLLQAEKWLDSHGKSAWVVLLVMSVITFWPIALVLLPYMLWKDKFSDTPKSYTPADMGSFTIPRPRQSTTGNPMFDEYKRESLERLKREEEEFKEFVKTLRSDIERDEFNRFMEQKR